MSDRVPSVAEALEIAALPDGMRAQLMELVRSAFFAGYDDAASCAEEDARLGMNWSHVPMYRQSCAGLWLTAEALPLLGVDVGCDIDEIYSPARKP